MRNSVKQVSSQNIVNCIISQPQTTRNKNKTFIKHNHFQPNHLRHFTLSFYWFFVTIITINKYIPIIRNFKRLSFYIFICEWEFIISISLTLTGEWREVPHSPPCTCDLVNAHRVVCFVAQITRVPDRLWKPVSGICGSERCICYLRRFSTVHTCNNCKTSGVKLHSNLFK